ncbi:hypothetical protein JCM3766R1_001544 [Sporobolomyces carnicolor]
MSLLPVELWRAVFEQLVDDSRALARVCLTSKSFLSIAQSILYRQLRLGIGMDSLLEIYVLCRRHLDSFRANPDLGSLVRSLHFFDNDLADGRHLEVRLSEAVVQLFELLQSLDIVLVERVWFWLYLDIVVAHYQDNSIPAWNLAAIRRRPTVFRLRLPKDYVLHMTTSCEGAYEEFDYGDTRHPHDGSFVPATFLSRSFGTLRAISIPLGEGIDLSPFRALERLSLHLTIGPSGHVIPTLVRVVPAIENLQSLRLRGSISAEDKMDLVNRGRIFDCLGPSIVSISLDYPLPLGDLVDLARSIPSATNSRPTSLKTFSYLPAKLDESNGTWSEDEVKEYEKRKSSTMDEFRKRGIELRFDASRA